MLSIATKKVVLGNIQLLDYCKSRKIDISKLNDCNIEKMNNKYFFVMPRKGITPTLDNDIDSQPSVVLTMDVSSDEFSFESTEWTPELVEDAGTGSK